jgi:hypothetical protein
MVRFRLKPEAHVAFEFDGEPITTVEGRAGEEPLPPF